jgi:hypothetical protein
MKNVIKMKLCEFNQIFGKEKEFIQKRRRFLNINSKRGLTGISLSGGGIRSSTFSFGFIKALKEKNAFKFDYISTVSGGGYSGSFILKRLLEGKPCCDEGAKEYLKRKGSYLTPHCFSDRNQKEGFLKKILCIFERMDFLSSWFAVGILRGVWYFLFFLFIILTLLKTSEYISQKFNLTYQDFKEVLKALGISFILSAFAYHFLHSFRKSWDERFLFFTFGFILSLLLIVLVLFFYPVFIKFFPYGTFINNIDLFFLFILVVIVGIFANPNILSMHTFYRMRLKDAFLEGKDYPLRGFLNENIPYPLINTTLNIIGDKSLAGEKSFDFFLFSPYFCGSKLTKYAETSCLYKDICLSTAVTISGAALNPMMGVYTNKLTAFIMNVLNLRLGYWADNPKYFQRRDILSKVVQKFSKNGIVFWPYYNLMEILGKSTLSRLKVNLSDGGHIENLGAFELLRRHCSLVVVVDAGMDRNYTFEDLKKLIQRAKNELNTEITFPNDEKPEVFIKPEPSEGFSKKNFCIGKINYPDNSKGIFVYIKTSITKDVFLEDLKKIERKDKNPLYIDYKDYNPDFPHETTFDQFFDPLQWEAYYRLGEDIGRKFVLSIEKDPKYREIKDLLL